jgi:hypothetical protein
MGFNPRLAPYTLNHVWTHDPAADEAFSLFRFPVAGQVLDAYATNTAAIATATNTLALRLAKFSSAATPWLAVMRPFAIESPSQFRADGPPALGTADYAADRTETKRLGSLNSTDRTAEQTSLERFYFDVTILQEAKGLRRLAASRDLSTAESARLYAQLYVSVADALIAGWDSKLHYGFWRPVTAIRNADSDGNPDTDTDAAWTPLTATPAHPEYPSAHAFISNAFTESLRQFFETKKLAVTLDSVTTGTSITYDSTDDIGKDINDARIYAGFHFRTACVHGSLIGRKVAKYVAKNYFQPIRKK